MLSEACHIASPPAEIETCQRLALFFKISTRVIAEVNRLLGRNLTFITRWSMQQTSQQEVVPMAVYVVYVHLLSLLYKVLSTEANF